VEAVVFLGFAELYMVRTGAGATAHQQFAAVLQHDAVDADGA
jgi:hypothetical protein